MLYIIENDKLRVKISSLGAELQSIRRLEDDTEYLWQADPTYWGKRATNIFPVCGKMQDGKYTYNGKTYELLIHGFAKLYEWTVVRQETTALTLRLTDTEETLAVYPFRFSVEMTYALHDDALSVTIIVHNLDEKDLIFAVGAHPGFNIPLNPGEEYDDYFIEFDEDCQPQRMRISAAGLFTGETAPYPLENNRILRLHHRLFDNDAVALQGAVKGLTVRSETGARCIHFSYPDMNYLLIWHMPKTDAPYVCIEPWTSHPGMDGKIEDLTEKHAMTTLKPQGIYRNVYTIRFQ